MAMMKIVYLSAAGGVLAGCGAMAMSDELPRVVGPMEHVMISIENGAIDVHLEAGSLPIELHAFPGDVYSGDAGVLNDSFYSSQYGWLAGGFIALNAGESIVIENTAMDEGLRVYEGGLRMMRDSHTYDAIFGTEGSSTRSTWAGTMRHDWFAADEAGQYQASFRVFVADAMGEEVISYGDSNVTLSFYAVPAPGAGLLLLGGIVGAVRRRRDGGAL
jgi:hypothetical protein